MKYLPFFSVTLEGESPIAHRPSPIAHRPSPIAHRPSPIAHRPSLTLVVFLLFSLTLRAQQSGCHCNNGLNIGLQGQVTRLSSLTNPFSGILPQSSASSIRCIRVEGTLLIDENYSFSSCDFTMMPNSKIEIAVNVTKFVLHASRLHGCDVITENMWQGIFQESGSSAAVFQFAKDTISEAGYGILIGDNPRLSIISCYFNRNYVSLFRRDEPDDRDFNVNSSNLAILTNNVFDCTQDLPPNLYTSEVRSLYAIWLVGGSNVRCGTANRPQSANRISNHLNGYAILGFNGFRDHYSTFTNINANPISGIGGVCLTTDNSDNSRFSFTNTSVFCSRSIVGINAGDVNFFQPNLQSQLTTMAFAGFIDLSIEGGRVVSTQGQGISIAGGGVNSVSRLRIQESDFIAGLTNAISIGPGAGVVNISDVETIASRGDCIQMIDRQTPSLIRRCTFSSTVPPILQTGGAGLKLDNVSNLQVAGNNFVLLFGGLQTSATENLFLCSNTFESCGLTGAEMDQANPGADFWCTDFVNNGQVGLFLTHQTSIGRQINRGNSWIDETATERAVYLSDVPLTGTPLSSNFRVGSTHLPSLDRILVLDPLGQLNANAWFQNIGNEPICPDLNDELLCNGVVPNVQPEFGDDFLYPWEYDELTLFDLRPLSAPVEMTPSELYIHETTKKHLIERLYENNSLLGSSDALATFYDRNLESDQMKQIKLERELELAYRLTANEFYTIAHTETEIEVLNQRIDEIQAEYDQFLLADETGNFPRETELNELYNEVLHLQRELKPVVEGAKFRQKERLLAYQESLNATVANSQSFTEWLKLKRLQAENAVDENYDLTEGQKDELLNLAWQCPWTHGNAVLTARALVEEWLGTDLGFPKSCTTEDRSASLEIQTNIVYPNPGAGEAIVNLEGFNVMFVTNSIGTFVPFNNKQVDGRLSVLNLTNNPDGLYYIQLVNPSGETKTLKYVKISK